MGGWNAGAGTNPPARAMAPEAKIQADALPGPGASASSGDQQVALAAQRAGGQWGQPEWPPV